MNQIKKGEKENMTKVIPAKQIQANQVINYQHRNEVKQYKVLRVVSWKEINVIDLTIEGYDSHLQLIPTDMIAVEV